MKSILKRAWAEISLDAVENNFKEIKKHIEKTSEKGVRIMAMVKADAYGHGAPYIAAALRDAGADFFGVSSIDEAVQLRNASIDTPVMITGYTPAEFIKTAIENDVSLTVYNLYNAEKISAVARKCGKKAKVHIKIDTGMNRLGFLAETASECEKSIEDISKVAALEGLEIEGTYTHFSDADGETEDYTRLQFSRFNKMLGMMDARGIPHGLRHCLNSAGIIRFSEYALDMVRPGLILYGLLPSRDMKTDIKLVPVMALKAAVSQIKEVTAGAEISYGRTAKLQKDSTLAVLPIGYADGLQRRLSGNYSVTVAGRKAPITGRICMDQTIVDVTGIPDVCEGDEAVIFGDGSYDKAPEIEALADAAGTVNYEICCIIGKRVPRLYFRNDRLVGRLNYILNRL